MDLFSDDIDFLAWYMTFFDGDSIECPYCGAEIDSDDEGSGFDRASQTLTCPENAVKK